MKVKEYVITSEEYEKAIKTEKIAKNVIGNVRKLFSDIGATIIVNHKELEHALINGFHKAHTERHSMTRDIVIKFEFKKD